MSPPHTLPPKKGCMQREFLTHPRGRSGALRFPAGLRSAGRRSHEPGRHRVKAVRCFSCDNLVYCWERWRSPGTARRDEVASQGGAAPGSWEALGHSLRTLVLFLRPELTLLHLPSPSGEVVWGGGRGCGRMGPLSFALSTAEADLQPKYCM